MIKLGVIDLEIIHLGNSKKGSFNESDIEGSSLKRLGVGRILDSLASLHERKLLKVNKNGSFSVTNSAKHILWDKKVPIRLRILRLLEIRPASLEEIAEILHEQKDNLDVIEKLRKEHMILMSALRKKGQLVKMYELLPKGADIIKELEELVGNDYTIIDRMEFLVTIEDVISHLGDLRSTNPGGTTEYVIDQTTTKLEKLKKKIQS